MPPVVSRKVSLRPPTLCEGFADETTIVVRADDETFAHSLVISVIQYITGRAERPDAVTIGGARSIGFLPIRCRKGQVYLPRRKADVRRR